MKIPAIKHLLFTIQPFRFRDNVTRFKITPQLPICGTLSFFLHALKMPLWHNHAHDCSTLKQEAEKKVYGNRSLPGWRGGAVKRKHFNRINTFLLYENKYVTGFFFFHCYVACSSFIRF